MMATASVAVCMSRQERGCGSEILKALLQPPLRCHRAQVDPYAPPNFQIGAVVYLLKVSSRRGQGVAWQVRWQRLVMEGRPLKGGCSPLHRLDQ